MNKNNENNKFENLIGKTLEEAKILYPEYSIRVNAKDGQHYMMIMDYRIDRINVIINDNIISHVRGIG